MTYYCESFNRTSLKQNRNIECCRWNNLVYVRTLKCGSEFFYRNFTQTADWEPIQYHNIDWEKDHVFSYIMDPITRRHKGISEFLIHTNTVDLLFNNPAFQQVISQVICLDEHSASLHNIYGSRINNMTWIPLVSDHQVAISVTNKMLSVFGHDPLPWNTEFEHTTAIYMDDIYNLVKKLWDAEFISDCACFYFEKDIELFLRTVADYDRNHC